MAKTGFNEIFTCYSIFDEVIFKRDFSEMVSRRDMVLTAFDGEVPEDP